MNEEKSRILDRVKEESIRAVSLQFTDLLGNIKGVTIPSHGLKEALERGVWFDGSSVEGFARIHESDMVLMPDPTTFQVLPWEPEDRKVARIICDVYRPDGRPFEGDPRVILSRVLARAEMAGFTYNTGAEVEFFLFKAGDVLKPVTHDAGGYFDFSPGSAAETVRLDLIDTFEALGMQVEMAHHEVAPGQHEIDIHYADALTTADNVMTLKYAVRAVAQKHGLWVTFMPKPIFGINGSGMHTHQSFFKDGKNVFYDPNDEYHLSSLAYHFIAGQIAHARALAAVVAPTVNSYKRLTPGYEAPVYICWARINRSALIRVPHISPARWGSARAELRCPDPSCNPYLAFAAMLAAGWNGIERGLTPPDPVEEDVYLFTEEQLQAQGIQTLPASLGEALDELAADGIITGALGSHAYEAFMRAKRAEFNEYRLQVSAWEMERYFATA
jgi:glutamine synthetase